MKKSKNIVLIVTPVLSAALFNACGSGSKPYTVVNTTTTTPASTPYPTSTVPVQTAEKRDVYNNLNDCIKDWSDKDLCEQMGEERYNDYRNMLQNYQHRQIFFRTGIFVEQQNHNL